MPLLPPRRALQVCAALHGAIAAMLAFLVHPAVLGDPSALAAPDLAGWGIRMVAGLSVAAVACALAAGRRTTGPRGRRWLALGAAALSLLVGVACADAAAAFAAHGAAMRWATAELALCVAGAGAGLVLALRAARPPHRRPGAV